MKPSFLASVVAATVLVVLVPALGLVVVVDPEGVGGPLVAGAVVLCSMATALRPTLVATAPSTVSARGLRWRRGAPLAVVGASLLVGLVALTESLGVVVALMLVAPYAAVLLGVLALLDLFARRVAREAPADRPLATDAALIDDGALKRRIRRTVGLGSALGALAAALTVVLTIATGRPPVTVLGLSACALLGTGALVVAVGMTRPMFATARRANAAADVWSGPVWRISWALTLGRAHRLRPADRELAPRWAHAAHPSMLVQAVFQPAGFTFVVVGQAVGLAEQPVVGPRFWFVVAMIVVAVPLFALIVRQYTAVRDFAAAHPESAPGTASEGTTP